MSGQWSAKVSATREPTPYRKSEADEGVLALLSLR
jgi:hypothetical protein